MRGQHGMLVDQILERNRAFVAGRAPVPLAPVRPLELAVVGCYDPRLDPLLLPALGLRPGEAFLLRSAGALLQPGSTTMRSLGLAMFMFDVTEVLIVGHASCRMASFDTAKFIEAFRRRGVPREAFGSESLRTWAGAIASPRQGLMLSVATVRNAPFVPKDVRVTGAILDEATCKLEVVVRADQEVAGSIGLTLPGTSRPQRADERAAERRPAPRAPAAAAPPPPPPRPAEAEPSRPEPRGTLARARARAARNQPTGEAAAAQALRRDARSLPLLQAMDDFVTTLRSKQHWRADIENLRQELERRSDPRQRLELLDAFARRLGSESREVRRSFERLRQEITATGADPAAELLAVFQQLRSRR